ncbi:FkbM family methyltransferase [Rhodospirillaceae bacterium SYSU D60014]|uniref:FkbM family methyltransferase n=1 Tax=Virgifigura deserti TaxID=2268457 RepID=UPI000E66CD42
MLGQLTLSKARGYMRWLLSHPDFRERPAQILWRAIQWQIRSRLHREPVVRFDDAIEMRSPRRNVSASSTFYFGFSEPAFHKFLSAYLQPGMTVVDIGANVGAYTLLAAKRVGPGGRVVAFEAAPQIYRFLMENVDRNRFGNVVVENVAVGQAEGHLRFTVQAGDLGKSHVHSPLEDDGVEVIDISVIDLDGYCSRSGLRRIDYMKIDVEGYEMPVLRGARRTLADNPTMLVQMEAIDHHAKRFGSDLRSIMAFMGEIGFRPHEIDKSGSVLTRLEDLDGYWGDVIWIHDKALDRLAGIASVRSTV